MLKVLKGISFAVLSFMIISSCGDNNEDPVTAPAPSIHVPNYKNHVLSAPNKVNIIFQLNDQNALPLPGLAAENVVISENGMSLNSSENRFTMVTQNDYDYLPYVALLIDVNINTETTLTEILEAAKSFVLSLPQGSKVQLYTFSDVVRAAYPYTDDKDEMIQAIDNISLGADGSNLLGAISRVIRDVRDSIDYNAFKASPGMIMVYTLNADTEGSASVEDISDELEDVRLYSISLGTSGDSSLRDISNRRGFVANTTDELAARLIDVNAQMDLYRNSIYIFNYESDETGDDAVSVIFSTSTTEAENNVLLEYTPSLFFNPDSFELKTDVLRKVSDGIPRAGSVIVRKDMSNDSVDFQLFSGFEPSRYDILFLDRDPATFNDWVNLNGDPDKIFVRIELNEFTLPSGFQSEFQNPAIFAKKYMVIRDDRNRKDLSYIQMTLQ